MMAEPRPRICLVVENAPYPFDRRVYLEATTLAEAGYNVVVIAPAEPGQALRERVGAVEVRRFPLRTGSSVGGYLREYGLALARIARLLTEVARERIPSVVHLANPPDVLFLAALPLRPLGTRIVFDHHDLMPELFAERYHGPLSPAIGQLLSLCERMSVRLADVVISTNASYRRRVIARHAVHPSRVFVVRNGPLLREVADACPDEQLQAQGVPVIGYVGLMAPQDGVGLLVDVAQELRCLGLADFRMLLIGDGPELPAIRARLAALGLAAHFDIRGRVRDHARVLSLLAACDLCVAPDPWTPANDVSTFIKVVEYLGLGRPIVATDLRETRASAGEAAVYVPPGNARAMAEVIRVLLQDHERRARLATLARERLVSAQLAWDFQRRRLLEVYQRLAGSPRDGSRGVPLASRPAALAPDDG